MKDRYLKVPLFERIKEDYIKYKGLVVAYDLDNTVKPYTDENDTFPKLITLLSRLKEINCTLICFTANPTEVARQYLEENEIPFDYINENPPFFDKPYRKIYYNALLDDRAGLKQVYKALNKLYKYVSLPPIVKTYGRDFITFNGIITLPVSSVGEGHIPNKVQTKTHPSGWTISGQTHEDYYEWVDDFIAVHPKYGRVQGSFNDKVYADSQEGYHHFIHDHPTDDWDTDDI